MAALKTSNKKFKFRFVFLIVAVVAILGLIIAFFADAPNRQELKSLVIGKVDFTQLRDGTYIGEYAGTKGSSRNATVKVTISGGEITDITILKGALDKEGNPAELKDGMTMNDLFQKVKENETLQVDTISGATLTSKAHLKALENALKQAEQ
ncbi:FMN-binding protein [Anaerocolumna sp. AGMB13025]|uniref:FMN-binding protein n=1 Tax=Anaerocolumna sp. AGMB13025 TaxID=3039116 RepID=UPI00241FF3B9|nr:FMN-binding protein [Anaerocolumna sp. AGMB13025]WFR55272.1 FMN-binding protein [Anaerocolumna sp. AGMB13025]